MTVNKVCVIVSVNSCVVTSSPLSPPLSPPQVGWFPSTYVEDGEEWKVTYGKKSEEKVRKAAVE